MVMEVGQSRWMDKIDQGQLTDIWEIILAWVKSSFSKRPDFEFRVTDALLYVEASCKIKYRPNCSFQV